jgi:hypothetical protein
VLHVSGHGESAADQEWLVLPAGRRLIVDDLLQNPPYRVPFVYLNTCNLGQTRYLGAGVSRSLAYSFAELGAPAVVAHTSPVSDASALRLATAFYDNAMDRSAGDALLAARSALIEDGESPVRLASAILIGDPDHSIVEAPARDMPDLASDVLDAYMNVVNDERRRAAAWTAALDALHERENPRIEAALGVVRIMIDVRNLSDPAQAAALDRAIHVCDALRHLPARAMLRFVRATQGGHDSTRANRADLLEDAIRFLEPLAAFEPAWSKMLSAARKELALERSRERGLAIQTISPTGHPANGCRIGGSHGTKVRKTKKGPGRKRKSSA